MCSAPPRGLLIPAIPATINGKLYFTLCATCAAEQKKGSCSHTDCQRAIRGTFCTPEINKALSLGYKVVDSLFSTDRILIRQLGVWTN